MTQQQQTYQPAEWKGSQKTAEAVRAEIARRWGEDEAEQYDPKTNCFTLPTWNSLGYRVKKGEHAIRSTTVIEAEPKETEEPEEGGETPRFRKPVYLFYRLQVEKADK